MKNILKTYSIFIIAIILLSACSLKTSSSNKNSNDPYYSSIKDEFIKMFVLYQADERIMDNDNYQNKLTYQKVLAGLNPSEMGIENFNKWNKFATFVNYVEPDAAYSGDLIAYLNVDFFNPDENQTPKIKGYNAIFYYESDNTKKWQLIKIKKYAYDSKNNVIEIKTAWDNNN